MSKRAPILNRTIRYEARNGRFRRGDFNLVNTSLGGMWEPRYLEGNGAGEATDLDDHINRVDKIEFDWDRRNPFHRDEKSGAPLIGGYVLLGQAQTFQDDAVTT